VGPLLHGALVGRDLPEELRSVLLPELERRRRRSRVDNLLLLDRFGRLADLLDEAGTPFIVLKGASLIPLIYKAAEERPMTDVDLLIARDNWPRTRTAVVESGRYKLPSAERERIYSRYHAKVEISTRETPSCEFEFHWNLEIEGRTALEPGRLMARAVPVELEGRRCRRLEDTDLALHLALHAAHHATAPRLIWIHDLALLAREGLVDWALLHQRAADAQLLVILQYALSYLEKAYPGTVPRELLADLPRGRLRGWLFSRVQTANPLLPTGDLSRVPRRWLYSLALLDGPGIMARFALKQARRRLFLRVPHH
jgi:hypothetical protein